MRFLLFLALLAGPASAQETIIAAEDQVAWNAVGRISIGGITATSNCTATLVAPALVLTAAHCVHGLDNATAERIATLIFVAGWNRGDYAAAAPAKRVRMAPNRVPGPLRTSIISGDVALVDLAEPIINVPPLPLWTEKMPERVGFVAYANSRLHAPALREDCFNVSRGERIHYLACGVVSGNSGAPVLAGLPHAPAVAGTLSARSQLGALAAGLHPWVVEEVAKAMQN